MEPQDPNKELLLQEYEAASRALAKLRVRVDSYVSELRDLLRVLTELKLDEYVTWAGSLPTTKAVTQLAGEIKHTLESKNRLRDQLKACGEDVSEDTGFLLTKEKSAEQEQASKATKEEIAAAMVEFDEPLIEIKPPWVRT